ncbi:bb7ff2ce-734c-442b-aa67-1f41e43e1353 [Sclerotinia trifoliorum]|uniref:Bb7ff2ce-734c-442b-aa67-1f41e43e1353 n=1 Tax=Sclerotinia trifoliorum TaxID=28548 RepID=A0A8H2ZNS6_9HELO|nr:bb7ff2ce-734c-442b-aa67-1f41e43e1353 [Sclerotinia trifoliorum]
MNLFLWSLSFGTVFSAAICDNSSGQTACGTTCCASNQYCESAGQCQAISSTATTPTSTVQNPEGFTTSISINVQQLWDLFVGPVETAATRTTVSATPVATSELIPPPPLYYPSFLSGAQVPLVAKNESWKFPSGFWWGVASAAYQVEGAAADEGRGPSVWDVFTHNAASKSTLFNDTGDVADNQYYLYKQDIARIAALGVPYYSFSISWSRVLPFGKGPVNELALQHYEDLIDTCIEFGIQPVVTLFHWDLPLFLQNSYGGWLSPDVIDDYVAYAKIIFSRFGNKVSRWFTMNEPLTFCDEYPYASHYFTAVTIPEQQQPYYCGHHVLLAHAKAYRLFKSMGLNGTVSFKNNGGYKVPLTNSSEDAVAVQRAWDFNEGWWANPVFINGDYPTYLKSYLDTIGLTFNDTEKALINGTADLFAHDAYSASYYMAPDSGIDACTSNSSHPLYPGCYNTTNTGYNGWLIGPASDPLSEWLHDAVDWLPAFLKYMQDTWPSKGGIAISEFGFAEPFEYQKTLLADIRTDVRRTLYYKQYMEAVLMAISEGINVVGCIAWSLMDNLEWAQGYHVKFGMQYVNFTTGERAYKASFFEYINAFKLYAEDPVVPVYVK